MCYICVQNFDILMNAVVGAQHLFKFILYESKTELVFLNPYGDQESMPRHQFRQPM